MANASLVVEQRWLAYDYTKLGRWPYFGWWTPRYHTRDALNTNTKNLADDPMGQWPSPQFQSRDAWNTSIPNLADKPTLANGPAGNRAKMTCIPLHKTWQMNLLWLMTPPNTRGEMPWIPVHKSWQTKLLCWWTPWYQSKDHLHTNTQNLGTRWTLGGRWTYFGQWPPLLIPEQRCLAYQYPILGRLTYFGQWTPSSLGTREEIPWIPLYKTF